MHASLVTIEIDGACERSLWTLDAEWLTPCRELFNAKGFPKDYVIEGVWQQFDDEWAWLPVFEVGAGQLLWQLRLSDWQRRLSARIARASGGSGRSANQ